MTKPLGTKSSPGGSRKDHVAVGGIPGGSQHVVSRSKHVDTPRFKQGDFFGIAYTPVVLKHREGFGVDSDFEDEEGEGDRSGSSERGMNAVDRFVASSLCGVDDDDFEEEKFVNGKDEAEKGIERGRSGEEQPGSLSKEKSRLARTQSTPEPRQTQEIRSVRERRHSFAPLLSIIDTSAPLTCVNENHPETNEDMLQRLQQIQTQQSKSKAASRAKPLSNNNSTLNLPFDNDNGVEVDEDELEDNVRVLMDAGSSSRRPAAASPAKALGKDELYAECVAHFRRLYERERSARVFAHSSSSSSVNSKPKSPSKRSRLRFGRSKSLSKLRGLLRTSPQLAKSIHEEKEVILSVQQTPLDIGDAIHRQLMQHLYASLTKTSTKTSCSMLGDHWKQIGFQGSNPGTDLRGAGMLTVLQTVWLDTNAKSEILRAAKASAVRSLPVMIVSINITVLCAAALGKGDLDKLCKRHGSAWTAVNELFKEIWHVLCERWNRGDVGLINFVKQVEAVLKHVLKRLKSNS